MDPMTRRTTLLSHCILLAALAPAVQAAPVPDTMLQGLQWRLVGPHRAGWGTMGQGIADQPDTFWFGGAGGGVWKTDDAGRTWQPMSEGLGTAPVGALAIAPSNPNVMYVGMGHPETRWDIAAGDGVYRSDDAGAHWHSLGLKDTYHTGQILVDPHNADVVLVAAVGHIFGPNPERGVFRSSDGGKTWAKTLFVDNDTGAIDLGADPTDPNIVFAATWQVRNYPWMSYFSSDENPGGGIHKSTDGGKTWTRLKGGGFPDAKLGRIGLAVTHVGNATRVYALIQSETQGGLYRSDDGGANWQRVNPDNGLVGGNYMARATVDPRTPDTLYVMGRSIKRSTDAGKTFEIIKGSPGGDDYHHLWINPKHPERMITASDQGTVVTVNGGKTWSSWYNQPTGQFYHLAADNRFPYWIYAGQQDNGTVRIASRSDYGSISYRDWHPVGADERDEELPDPQDPNIVYGSGLGGRLSRWDARTGEVQNITPWPISSYGQRPTQFRHHYTWITPIAVSQTKPYPLYFGSQQLFRSTDQGQHWDTISPDLSGKQPEAKDCDGDVTAPAALACGYGTIYEIEPAPGNNNEIWVGTDSGAIHLTRDAGATWRNVTPKGLRTWSMVSRIDVPPGHPGTAYVAVDNHRQDDYRPHVYITHDYGASWREANAGLPGDHVVSVVRADPHSDGLLFAGTEVGVFVSLDDGAHWQSLQRNLPVAWARDLMVKDNDLVVATQGRAIWALDDLGLLRGLSTPIGSDTARLFKPSQAVRLRRNQNKDTPLPPDEPVGQNPPTGAVLDYWLAKDARRVVLEIHDDKGHTVRRFASDDVPVKIKADRYFAQSWIAPEATVSAKAGAHRFVWDLRFPRPRAAQYEWSIAAVQGTDTTALPAGALALPGSYQVSLEVDGKRYSQPLVLRMDPRVDLSREELTSAFAFSSEVSASLAHATITAGEVKAVRKQLAALTDPKRTPVLPEALLKSAKALDAAAAPLLSGDGDDTTNLGAIGEILAGIASDVEGTDRGPVQGQREVLQLGDSRYARALATWDKLKAGSIPDLDQQLAAANLPKLHIPAASEIDNDEAGESKDLP